MPFSAQTIGHRVKCLTWLESVLNPLSEKHLGRLQFFGQTSLSNIVLEPILLEINNGNLFKYIQCFKSFSTAVDINGFVYYWGKLHLDVEIQWTPNK